MWAAPLGQELDELRADIAAGKSDRRFWTHSLPSTAQWCWPLPRRGLRSGGVDCAVRGLWRRRCWERFCWCGDGRGWARCRARLRLAIRRWMQQKRKDSPRDGFGLGDWRKSIWRLQGYDVRRQGMISRSCCCCWRCFVYTFWPENVFASQREKTRLDFLWSARNSSTRICAT